MIDLIAYEGQLSKEVCRNTILCMKKYGLTVSVLDRKKDKKCSPYRILIDTLKGSFIINLVGISAGFEIVNFHIAPEYYTAEGKLIPLPCIHEVWIEDVDRRKKEC